MGSQLRDLLSGLAGVAAGSFPDCPVTGVVEDSRRVLPGSLFVAIPGSGADGHRFIPQAVQAGACAVVGEERIGDLGIPYVRVPDSRRALSILAAGWWGFPARKMVMIGVTGTDGKTTTCSLIFEILKQGGVSAGMISTVHALIGREVVDTGFHVTTPGAPDLQALLARMVQAGITHCVLEVTSHALAQRRVEGCEFDIGAVTNITREHLDYHSSFEAYREAKSGLLAGLANSSPKPYACRKLAVLNREDPSFEFLQSRSTVEVLSYGRSDLSQVRGTDIRLGPAGLQMQVQFLDTRFALQSPLLGAHNAFNVLAAVGVTAGALGLPRETVAEGVHALRSVPGRMELIDLGQDFTAIVDFAHTPNALKAALGAARGLTTGRVIAVFGSAGLRDREKRGLMAAISVDLADFTLLTAEDPRTEEVKEILTEMASGARGRGGVEGKNFWSVPDRSQAILSAVELAEPGDLVIVCGKGHEQSMCFGEVEYPWDDRLALRAAIAQRLHLAGWPMPRLPTWGTG
ncbi:MAG: UDP-N-acetylmuramoyl-L-alanyl-D-glutamate--2,6-diaminopimelate ligase [Anaerolineales bacterium]|jgi:UDP-N-acetylmuramoyl-L-alanyl-D-glutamate--2,6-diaminopimelate ligase